MASKQPNRPTKGSSGPSRGSRRNDWKKACEGLEAALEEKNRQIGIFQQQLDDFEDQNRKLRSLRDELTEEIAVRAEATREMAGQSASLIDAMLQIIHELRYEKAASEIVGLVLSRPAPKDGAELNDLLDESHLIAVQLGNTIGAEGDAPELIRILRHVEADVAGRVQQFRRFKPGAANVQTGMHGEKL